MIKNMQHTYIQHGTKFYTFIEPIFSTTAVGQETRVINSHNFYVFDEEGYCWMQLIHVEIEYVLNQLGNGFFKTRPSYTLGEPVAAFRKPTVASDEWIQGSQDRGYALETIKESLGLNLTYLTHLMEDS